MLQDVVRTLYLDDINDIIILLAQCFSVVTFTLNSSIKDNGFCVCVCVFYTIKTQIHFKITNIPRK